MQVGQTFFVVLGLKMPKDARGHEKRATGKNSPSISEVSGRVIDCRAAHLAGWICLLEKSSG